MAKAISEAYERGGLLLLVDFLPVVYSSFFRQLPSFGTDRLFSLSITRLVARFLPPLVNPGTPAVITNEIVYTMNCTTQIFSVQIPMLCKLCTP